MEETKGKREKKKRNQGNTPSCLEERTPAGAEEVVEPNEIVKEDDRQFEPRDRSDPRNITLEGISRSKVATTSVKAYDTKEARPAS